MSSIALRATAATRHAIRITKHHPEAGAFSGKLKCLLESRDRLAKLTQLNVCTPEVEVGQREVRFHFQRRPRQLHHLFVTPLEVSRPFNRGAGHQRQRIERLRLRQLREGLFETLTRREILGVPLAGGNVSGVKFECALKRLARRGKVPIVEQAD